MRRITGAVALILVMLATALFDLHVEGPLLPLQVFPLCGLAMLYGLVGALGGILYVAALYLPMFARGMLEAPMPWEWLLIAGVSLLVGWVSMSRERSLNLTRMHQQLLASMRDGVILADGKFAIHLVNPAACLLLALPDALAERQAALERIGLLAQWTECMCRVSSETREYRVGERVLQITVTPALENAEVVGLVTTVVDFTAERQLTAMREDFLALISHELRNPLTSINGFSDLLLASASPNDIMEHARVIKRNCSHLLRLIQDLLQLHSLEAGHFRLQPVVTNLTALLREGVEAALPLACEAGVHIRFLSCPEGVVGWYDPDRLAQVIANLLENAVKHSPRGEVVEIALSVAGQEALINIRDHGGGIPPGELQVIFEKYYQSASGRKTGKGAGLGLAISRQLVELHGGKVWATNDDPGTSFRVSLPILHVETEADILRDEMPEALVNAYAGE